MAEPPQTYYSDTTKPTDQVESWQVNAVQNVISQQNRTTTRQGEWLRQIKLTVYGAVASQGAASGDKTGSAGADQGGDKPPFLDYPMVPQASPPVGGSQAGAKADPLGGLDLSDLRINFSVRKTTNASPNLFKARVYNLSKPPGPDTIGKVRQYGRVQLAAGYEGEDNMGMIFDGTVVLYIIGKENPVDSYIEIHAGDADEALNHAVAALNWPAGSTPSQRNKDILTAAGIPVGQVVAAQGEQKAIRAMSYIGMADRGIRINTNATKSDFFIEDGKAYIIPWNGYRGDEIVELSPATGLVGLPKVTPNGIEAQCLLNPKLRLGGLVHIRPDLLSDVPFMPGSQTSFANPNLPPGTATGASFNYAAAATSPEGYYKILLLDHFGDTRGNEWYSAMVCAAAGKDGSLLQTSFGGTALQRTAVANL